VDPRPRLERREIIGGGVYVLFADRLGDGRHRARAFAGAAFVVDHLVDEITHRQRRDIGRLVVAGAGRQMAGGTGAHGGAFAMGDDLRHRRMQVGITIGRIEQIVDLLARIGLVAARHGVGLLVGRQRRLHFVGHGEGPVGPLGRIGQHRRKPDQQRA
jgi:hypothetical protein